MLRIILARFWVVFLPFALYVLWLLFITRKTRNGHYVGEHIRKAALFWTCASSIGLLIGCCIWWAISQGATGDATYVPAHNVGGKLIHEQIVK